MLHLKNTKTNISTKISNKVYFICIYLVLHYKHVFFEICLINNFKFNKINFTENKL